MPEFKIENNHTINIGTLINEGDFVLVEECYIIDCKASFKIKESRYYNRANTKILSSRDNFEAIYTPQNKKITYDFIEDMTNDDNTYKHDIVIPKGSILYCEAMHSGSKISLSKETDCFDVELNVSNTFKYQKKMNPRVDSVLMSSELKINADVLAGMKFRKFKDEKVLKRYMKIEKLMVA